MSKSSVSLLKIPFLFISSIFLVLTTPDLSRSGEIERSQTGPGLSGTLIPLSSFKLQLVRENVQISANEEDVSIKAVYDLENNTDELVQERLGIPSLKVESTAPSTFSLKITDQDGDHPFEKEEVVMADAFDYRPFLPLDLSLTLKHAVYSFTVTVQPRSSRKIIVEWQLNYLSKKEVLRGRREESGKLFRYVRSFAAHWPGPLHESVIEIKPGVSQLKQLKITPEPVIKPLYKYEKKEFIPSAQDDITVLYDPIQIQATPFGFQGNARPQPLEPHDGKAYDYANLFDEDVKTAWCEGERGNAVSKGFEVEWGKQKNVQALEIYSGVGPEKNSFLQRNRLKTIRVYLGKPGWFSAPMVLQLRDTPDRQVFPLNFHDQGTLMLIQIVDVYQGAKFNDTCISDLVVQFQPHQK